MTNYIESIPDIRSFEEMAEPLDTVAGLVAPAVEFDQGLLYEPVRDDRELLEKAHAVRDELSKDIARQKQAISLAIPESAPRIRADFVDLDVAIDYAMLGDWTYLSRNGFAVDAQWLGDITRSMLRNRPVEVEVAAVRPFDRIRSGSLGEASLYRQRTGVMFGAMLRRMQAFEYTRPVAMIDDRAMRVPASQEPNSEDIVTSTYHRLERAGVIKPGDVPGKDFLLLSLSASEAQTDELIERIDASESGMIATYGDGQVFLRPSKRVYESMVEHYKSGDAELYRSGVLLRKADGTPTQTALEAATYLRAINTQFTHVRLRDTPIVDALGVYNVKKRDSESLSIVLQSLNITHRDRDHTIYYDSQFTDPNRAVYALTRLLHHEVSKIIESLSELDDVAKAMKPKDYFNHNYNSEKGMWPEDVQGVRAVGSELPLHFEPGEITSAAIIGYGPFSYPGIAIAPFMAKGAKIDISDLLPSNITFAEEWFSGNAEESHDDVYRRFANQFRQGKQSGRFYAHAEQQLREAGNLHVAALEDLPADSAQVILESFVSCSNNIEKYGFYETIRQKARIMTWTPRSMMVSVHMVGSGGWNNSGDHEGVKIPAANLTIGNIEDGYRASGLRVVSCVPLHADSNFREDYKGMVVIFAKPDTIDRPLSLVA